MNLPQANGNNVVFIAPNGARIICKDWRKSMATFNSKQLLAVIFNDPLLTETK